MSAPPRMSLESERSVADFPRPPRARAESPRARRDAGRTRLVLLLGGVVAGRRRHGADDRAADEEAGARGRDRRRRRDVFVVHGHERRGRLGAQGHRPRGGRRGRRLERRGGAEGRERKQELGHLRVYVARRGELARGSTRIDTRRRQRADSAGVFVRSPIGRHPWFWIIDRILVSVHDAASGMWSGMRRRAAVGQAIGCRAGCPPCLNIKPYPGQHATGKNRSSGAGLASGAATV